MTEATVFIDPVVNVIEEDVPGRGRATVESDGIAHSPGLDAAAMDAVLARRRREFDAARARLGDQTLRDNVDKTDQTASGPAEDATPGIKDAMRIPIEEPPERVRKRYLRTGNQYFMRDSPFLLAFEDRGSSLVTAHNRPDVVESMVDMASAKSWQRVRVAGHEAFRSEAWLQGMLRDIEVSGYEPSAADLARLADARQTRLGNRMEADVSTPVVRTSAPASDSSRTPPAAISPVELADVTGGVSGTAPPRSESDTRPRRVEFQQAVYDDADPTRQYAGELREHGAAPYQNNPARSDSYYVVFRDATGADHIAWGVDLERAVRESHAEPGQQITLKYLGRRLVTVKSPISDASGVEVGEGEKDVWRNTWRIDVVEPERSVAGDNVHQQRPVGTTSPSSATMHKDRAERLPFAVSEQDKVLHLAVLAGAMWEQGFSARSIARVRECAERMLDAFTREGISIPRPRVFDPQAPAQRGSRLRPATGRAPAHEIERTPAEPGPCR